MPSGTNTPKLDLLRIQETWQFGDEAFNRFIDDADDKLVGIAHLDNPVHWKGWKKETTYAKNDIVRITNGKSHQYYQCITGGTSGTTEPTNNVTGSVLTDGTVKWMVMSLSEADVNGGTIKIWLSGSYYNRGDAVLYGTSLYRCKVDHTATTWTSDYIYWQEIFASIRLWKPTIYYFEDDTVIQDGLIYKCKTAHMSASSFSTTEEANWELIGGVGGAKIWASDTSYKEGQFVISDGILYRALQDHTSGSSFSADLAKWEVINANIAEWKTGSYYPVGALVQYGNIMYKCTTSHISESTFSADRSSWALFHNIPASISPWTINTYYYVGQSVVYNNNLYRCNTAHTSSNTAFSDDGNNWDIVYSSISLWSTSKYYKVGSVVIYNNKIYRCKTAHTSSNNSFAENIENWDEISAAIIDDWKPSTKYSAKEVVLYDGVIYRANVAHTSSSTFSTDSSKWNLVYANIDTYANNTFYKAGREVIYNKNLYRCLADHTSSTDTIGIVKFYEGESTPFITIINLSSLPQSYTLDLGAIKKITEVSFNHGGLYLTMTEIDIATSSDNVNFTNVYHYHNLSTTQGETVDANIYSTARYIKITVTDAYYTSGYGQGTATAGFLNVWVEDNNWELIGSKSTYISFWEAGNRYSVNDIVIYNDEIYKCIDMHYSSSAFSTDSSKWIKLSDLNIWSASTFYKANTLIYHQGNLYKATTDFTSGSTFSSTNLEVLTDYGLKDWQANKTYKVNDIFVNDGQIYRVLMAYTSGATFENPKLLDPFTPEPWKANTAYVTGDIFEESNILYRVVNDFTSGTIFSVTSDIEVCPIVTFAQGTNIAIGDVVENNGDYYIAMDNFECGSTLIESRLEEYVPKSLTDEEVKEIIQAYDPDSSSSPNTFTGHYANKENLIKIMDGISKKSSGSGISFWKPNTVYYENQLILYNDLLYRVTTDFTSGTIFNDTNLGLIGGGLKEWKPNTEYKENTILVYDGQIYETLVGFTSGNAFSQIDILEDYTLVGGETPILWAQGVEITTNDIVAYNGNYYKALVDFTCGAEFTEVAFEKYVPKSLTDTQIENIIEKFNPVQSGTTGFVVENNAGAHNALYREKDLTDYFNSGQMSIAIASGTFEDIFPGDYIIKSVTVNGTTYADIKWIVGTLDYFLHNGDTKCTTHHLLMFPEVCIGTAQMNTSNTSSGGYVGSIMWTTTIPLYVTGIRNAFGTDHVLSHRELLTTSMDTNGRSSAYCTLNGAANNWAWQTVLANLFNENMVYGGAQCSSSMFDTADGNHQVQAMRHNRQLMFTRSNWYCLRSVHSSTNFATCSSDGHAGVAVASSVGGVRPYFLLT